MKKKIKSDTNIEQNLDELLKILICPKTGSKLLFDKEKNELVSKKAKLAYPIKGNIPILLENKARKLS
tara:strand:+ start:3786 stop:3989 length:204 start_codon:yes stop_codon:yes gene_type:complete